MASKSSCPLLWEPLKMTSNKAPISRAASRWIASAVFFLGCQGIFHWPCLTDLLIHFQQLPTEFAEAVEGIDLTLGLLQLGAGRKGFAYGLTVHLARQAVVGAVTGLTGLMTAAVRLAAAPAHRCDRTAAKIAQLQDLSQNSGSLLFQDRKRSRQGAPLILTYRYVRIHATPKINPQIFPFMSRTPLRRHCCQ